MSEFLNDLSLTELIAPIRGGSGDDLSFSSLFDQIKEARRADAAYLTQGDWQTELKCSDWEHVISLSALGLAQQSKDLMLVGWLNEGLAHRDHFEGMTFGLKLAGQILESFWDTLYPTMDEGLDERATRLSWLITTLTGIACDLPITQGEPYGVSHYDESRHVENLALQNPKAMQTALDEGKINAEIFQRSVLVSNTGHLQEKVEQIVACLQACEQLEACAKRLLGTQATSFTSLVEILDRARQLTEKLLKDRGGEMRTHLGANATSADSVPIDVTTESRESTCAAMHISPKSRDEAFIMLAGIAGFFKQSEPQSPVPYLIERAIKWGNMPLEGWLSDVIKDSSVVDTIRDVLGTGGHGS